MPKLCIGEPITIRSARCSSSIMRSDRAPSSRCSAVASSARRKAPIASDERCGSGRSPRSYWTTSRVGSTAFNRLTIWRVRSRDTESTPRGLESICSTIIVTPHVKGAQRLPDEGGRGSNRGMLHEGWRDRFPPRTVEGIGPVQTGERVRIERVGIGPVLVHAAPGVLPIVVDVAAELMPADAPDMGVTLLLEMIVADHRVVDVLDPQGQVIGAGFLPLNAEEDVVVEKTLAAIEAIERADQIVRGAGIDIIRCQKAERVAIPGDLPP